MSNHPLHAPRRFACLLALAATAIGPALSHEPTASIPAPKPRSGPGAAGETPARPPAPAGVTDLDFRGLFRMPIGRQGLEYSDEARRLEGKKVRLLGYMARTDHPAPGLMILSPYPFVLHEDEYGMADDLPPTVVHVLLPDRPTEPVPFTPGPLLLTGTLELGAKSMPDGRQSFVRLLLDPAPATGAEHHAEHADHADHATHGH
jgi:hypothetical protein